MKERIIQLLTKENLSATRFADILGVQRSSISHILSGRNKPSFDFIEKVLVKFPEINAEWLIIGKGEMYKLNNKEELNTLPEKDVITDKTTQKAISFNDNPNINGSININDNIVKKDKVTNVNIKKIVRIIFFYDDKSFTEYFPE